jgi:type I restriction enzyme S subunit
MNMPWYGKLPDRWETQKISELFVERREKVSDTDFAPLSVSKGGIVPQIATVAKSNAGDNRKLVRKGDFAVNSRSDRRGSSGVSEYDGSVSLINIVLTPRSETNGRYWHYLLKSHNFIEEYYRNGRGIVADLWTTRYTEMKNIYLPLPPRAEQDQIVRFLDWKVSSINRLINAKRREVGLLGEMKRGVINEAVTRGGEGWNKLRLKNLVHDINEKGSPKDNFYIGMENIVSWASELVETENTADGDCKTFINGDLLFGKLRPYLAKVYAPDREGVCSGEFLVLRGFQGYLPFLKYFLMSYDFIMLVNASTYGAKMPRANWDFIGNCIVALPSREEQEIIANHLDDQCGCIDKLAAKLNDEIALFAEYRTRLISDTVTGKADVRNVVVPECESVEDVAVIDGDGDSVEDAGVSGDDNVYF